MPYNMLSEEEKNILQNEVLQDIRVKRIDFTGPMDREIFYEVQTQVLSEYGVMCPHSENWQEPADHPKAKRCRVCGALLLPDTWRAELSVKANTEVLFPTK